LDWIFCIIEHTLAAKINYDKIIGDFSIKKLHRLPAMLNVDIAYEAILFVTNHGSSRFKYFFPWLLLVFVYVSRVAESVWQSPGVGGFWWRGNFGKIGVGHFTSDSKTLSVSNPLDKMLRGLVHAFLLYLHQVYFFLWSC